MNNLAIQRWFQIRYEAIHKDVHFYVRQTRDQFRRIANYIEDIKKDVGRIAYAADRVADVVTPKSKRKIRLTSKPVRLSKATSRALKNLRKEHK